MFEQLNQSINYMVRNNGGIILYLEQEGRGIGLANKMRAYSLQARGMDTIDADHNIGFLDDERDFNIAARIRLHVTIEFNISATVTDVTLP